MKKGWKSFDTIAECAASAAPVFAQNNWRWNSLNAVPNEREIVEFLNKLQSMLDTGRNISSGRLTVQNSNGKMRYWHEGSQ